MDTPGHGLWSALIFWWTGHPALAALIGIMPDIIGFMPVTIYAIFRKDKKRSKDFIEDYNTINPGVRKYAETMYKPTHSLIVSAIISIITLLIWPGAWWMLAWPLHVLVDIPTHSKKFFPTPFLWPISSYVFNGISWANPRFMITHYGLLIIGWATLFML